MKELTNRLKDLHKYVTFYNRMSPFPVFDTEYVEMIENNIKKMDSIEEYDKMPVVACKHCDDLHILTDDEENDVCMRCGSINEINIYENIEQYLYKTEK